MDQKELDQQSQYWEESFLSKPEMFGQEPSKAAVNTLKFFKEHNPLALRDASQRLLEANERQMWAKANPQTLESLEAAILEIQGDME